MEVFGRSWEEQALMRACRLVPLPDIRTVRRDGAGSGSGDVITVVVKEKTIGR